VHSVNCCVYSWCVGEDEWLPGHADGCCVAAGQSSVTISVTVDIISVSHSHYHRRTELHRLKLSHWVPFSLVTYHIVSPSLDNTNVTAVRLKKC